MGKENSGLGSFSRCSFEFLITLYRHRPFIQSSSVVTLTSVAALLTLLSFSDKKEGAGMEMLHFDQLSPYIIGLVWSSTLGSFFSRMR